MASSIASVYATGMLRGRTDRYHRLGFVIAFSVAAVATPIQMGVGDSLARWVYNNQPVKFAAIELVPTTSSDVPETLLGRLNDDGTVSGGIPIPGLASWLSDPSTGTVDGRAGAGHGARGRPTDRPSGQHRPSRLGRHGRAWERCCSCCRRGTGVSWVFRRRMPASRWFLRAAAASGVLSVICLEAGWIVAEVGRQPWIVYEIMKVEDAATGNTGVWISFVAVVVLYLAAGRHHDPRPARNEQAVPQSRRLRRARCALRAERAARGAIPDARGGGPVITAVAVVLLVGGASRMHCSAAPISGPGSGT